MVINEFIKDLECVCAELEAQDHLRRKMHKATHTFQETIYKNACEKRRKTSALKLLDYWTDRR